MAIDPYSLCPCGSGKKVKFCCAELAPEYEKIHRMLDGGQQVACLDHVEKLLVKHPKQVALLNIKSALLRGLDRLDKARETIEEALEAHPNHHLALAEAAIVTAESEGGVAALGPLHKALVACNATLSVEAYEAIHRVVEHLLEEGQVIAARAHLMLMATANPDDDDTFEMLRRINGSPGVPGLLKLAATFPSDPDDAPWKDEIKEIAEDFAKAQWNPAADKLAALAERVGNEPRLWRLLGTVRTWLADDRAAVAAFRREAALDLPLDDAVEAEARAQLLDDLPDDDQIDSLMVTYPVADLDRLAGQLASDSRAVPADASDAMAAKPNEPPPRAVYALLDRLLPEHFADLDRSEVPRILGMVALYGKQTDRPARIELRSVRPELEAGMRSLAALAGDSISDPGEPEVERQVPCDVYLTQWSWWLPRDTPQDEFRALSDELRRRWIIAKWPEMPLAALGGKSPREASSDPTQKVPILAAILLLEESAGAGHNGETYNALRAELGLPIPAPIDPTEDGVNVELIPHTRLGRLIVENLTDEKLSAAYETAAYFGHFPAAVKFGEAILERPTFEGKSNKQLVCALLSEVEPDPRKALEYLDRGRSLAEAAGQSSAQWDVRELRLQARLGDGAAIERLLRHLQAEHLDEPGVREAIMQFMINMGVITPDGRPVSRGERGIPGSDQVDEPAAAAAPTTGGLWTPESADAGKSGKLWTPDMDD